MTLEPLPSWLLPVWRDLVSRRERLPHALLLSAPEGSGKRLLAEHFARALLCRTPTVEGFACGVCPDCAWIASSNHPDFFYLVPESEQSAEEGDEDSGAATGDSPKKEKSKSTQILIDQIRQVQSSLEVGAGGHAGGRRVVLIDPAEAMNVAAANALLKALEEPPGSAVFLLVSAAPRRLLPTIRSRCQALTFPLPRRSEAEAWFNAVGLEEDAALISFAGGLPLAARRLAQGPLAAVRSQLGKDLVALRTSDPLKLAADWEARLKAKGALEAGLDMPLLIDWLQRWVSDGARVAMGGRARFFSDYETELRRLASGQSESWLTCYNELNSHRRVAAHPLNARLFLEEMWLVVRRRIGQAKPPPAASLG